MSSFTGDASDIQSFSGISSNLGSDGSLETPNTSELQATPVFQGQEAALSSLLAGSSLEIGDEPDLLEIKRFLETQGSVPTQSFLDISSAEVAYKDLVEAMNSSLCRKPFRIDLLPDSHQLPSGLNVLVEGDSMSLTKATLIKVYPLARREFWKGLADLSHPSNQEAIMEASAIILLQSPENLTAANARKRVIIGWEQENKEKGLVRILMDLCFLGSLLMSPLPQHPKSPTLWAHRRWLFRRISRSSPFPVGNPMIRSPLVMEREISLVGLTAAHHHAANYHAWDYMRWWVANHPDLLANFGRHLRAHSKAQAATGVLVVGLPVLTNLIQQWCLNHPSDTSGWSFLLWLFTVPGTWSLPSLHLQGPFDGTCKTILERVSSLKLRHEAVWIFLRTIMSAGTMDAQRRMEFSMEARNIQASPLERARSQMIAAAALQWLEKYA